MLPRSVSFWNQLCVATVTVTVLVPHIVIGAWEAMVTVSLARPTLWIATRQLGLKKESWIAIRNVRELPNRELLMPRTLRWHRTLLLEQEVSHDVQVKILVFG